MYSLGTRFCLRNICINTLHKGDNDDDYDDDDDDNNNTNNKQKYVFFHDTSLRVGLISKIQS
jgi:hypothetical protein